MLDCSLPNEIFLLERNGVKILDSALKLNSKKTLQELCLAIDNIYDLEHNTGSIFSKNELEHLFVSKETLDERAKIQSVVQFYSKCSNFVKKIIKANPILLEKNSSILKKIREKA